MPKRTGFRRTVLALAVVQALAISGSRAATLTVDSDQDDNGTGCTLREANAALGAGMNQNGCSNSSADGFGSNDTIVFDAGLNGSAIMLSSGFISIGNVTISGPGADLLTIDGDGSCVFQANSTTLALSGLSITGGGDDGSLGGGGGMFIGSSNVTLTDVTISGNTVNDEGGGLDIRSSTVEMSSVTVSDNTVYAISGNVRGGGLYASNSTITMSNVEISHNTAYSKSSDGLGGGLYVKNSMLTLTGCTVTGNSAEFAGGLYVQASSTMTMSNCAVSGNSTSANGAGINTRSSAYVSITGSTISGNSAGEQGGGIYNGSKSSVALTNSTVSGNTGRFGGGMLVTDASSTLTNSTVSGNTADSAQSGNIGGGIYTNNDATVTLANSIVSGNTATGSVSEISTYSSSSLAYNSTIIAAANNIFGDSTKSAADILGITLTGTSDIIATSEYQNIPLASILSPLADNGGPTLTHALVSGSPAIGAANPADCPGEDQRGIVRDSACDIGAFELADGFCVPIVTVTGNVALVCL